MEVEKKITPAQYYASISKEDKRAIKTLNGSEAISFIPTGSWVIDRLIGNGGGKSQSGGLPRGHIVEVFGDESCGKTTLGMSACVEAQRMGLIPVWLDYERTFSKDYAKKMGLDLSQEKFIFHNPDHFEHGIKLIGQALPTYPALIVIDSVSAMIPRTFMEAEEDDPGRIGEQARIMSRFLSMMGKYISEYNVCLLFINQLRSVIKQSKYDAGPMEETSGGRSLKYYCSVRIKMKKSKIDYIKTVSRITGKSEDTPNNINVKVTIIKNKIDVPYYSGPIFLKFGEGFDNITSIIDLADNCGVIKKSGAYYRFDSGDNTLFNVSGRENLRDFLEKNPKVLDTLSSSVKLKVDEEEKAEGVKEIQEINENDDVENILDQVKKKLDKPEAVEMELKDTLTTTKATPKGKKNAKG